MIARELISPIFRGPNAIPLPHCRRLSTISNPPIYQSEGFSPNKVFILLQRKFFFKKRFSFVVFFSVLCSSLKSAPATTILSGINLDSNSIEHVVNDPFKFCPNLTSISMANNSISRLPSGNFFLALLSIRLHLFQKLAFC